MIGDREIHFCDTGGMGMLYELDPAQYWSGPNDEGLRNILILSSLLLFYLPLEYLGFTQWLCPWS